MIDRIAKLLAKAESAATPEEAHAYFEKAQALATAHSISLARARLHHRGSARAPDPVHRTIRVGEPRRHSNRPLVTLMAVVAEVNDVKIDVAHNSTYVIAYGFADDIDAAEHLWSHVATRMTRFADHYLTAGQWRSDVRYVRDRRGYRAAPMTKQTARATYYDSFITTLHSRLTAARDTAVRAADTQQPAGHHEPGAALVLREKAVAVGSYYANQSSARGTWSGRSTVIGESESARRAGARDARTVDLRDSSSLTGPRPALPS